jgi:AP-2 complex subunit alpha
MSKKRKNFFVFSQTHFYFIFIFIFPFLDSDRNLIRQACSLLGRFLSGKEANIKYLALEAMANLSVLDQETHSLVKKHQETVVLSLRDADISIRKRALDLLYGMCDNNSAASIVSELLNYLVSADYAIKEELVIKVAILGDKFAKSQGYAWYVDVILQLITLAGEYVSDDIWYRLIHTVTNHEDIQEYAARQCFEVKTFFFFLSSLYCLFCNEYFFNMSKQ